jgi:glycerol kinase
MAGDQQAAAFGQAAFGPGMMKSTYGTGCFALINTGPEAVSSTNKLLTTLAWMLNGEASYALEGSIFIAGSAIKWLRDGLGIIHHADATQSLAGMTNSTDGVYMVPAFTGLGAPYWDPEARGAILGMTLNTGAGQIARAALEAVCYQTRDLLGAMTADNAPLPPTLRVDGGMAVNNWMMQFLADMLDVPVERPVVTETTALGAAYFAGLATGFFRSTSSIERYWKCEQRFEPSMATSTRDALYQGWLESVERVRNKPKVLPYSDQKI